MNCGKYKNLSTDYPQKITLKRAKKKKTRQIAKFAGFIFNLC
ncbi:hypothetical protein FEM08_30930 [Flavobacterium gilvum]|nr:hypothetical protein FEM08_30930 [Flavobacterium gilvum]